MNLRRYFIENKLFYTWRCQFLKNERGYALVSVLLIMLIIVTVAGYLMNSIISNRQQITYAENDVQGIDLAEIGMIQLEKEIQNMTITSEFCKDVKDIEIEGNVETNYSYQVEVDNNSSINCDEPGDKTLKIKSSGSVNGEVEHVMRGDLILDYELSTSELSFKEYDMVAICENKNTEEIRKAQEDGLEVFLDDISGSNTFDGNSIVCSSNDPDTVYVPSGSNIYFHQFGSPDDNQSSITIDGYAYINKFDAKNNTNININEDGMAYIDDLQVKNNAELTINGDAYIRSLVPQAPTDLTNGLTIHGNLFFDTITASQLFIYGNGYGNILNIDKKLSAEQLCYNEKNFNGNRNQESYTRTYSCLPPPDTKNHKFPVSDGTPDWTVNPMINVEYFKD